MKKSVYLFFVGFICAMALFSCSSSSNDEGDKTPANPLIGTWYTEGEEKGQATYTEITYNADLTCTWRDYKSDRTTIKESDSGKYQVNGNKLTILWNSEPNSPWSTTFSISGNRMTTSEGGGTVWIKK